MRIAKYMSIPVVAASLALALSLAGVGSGRAHAAQRALVPDTPNGSTSVLRYKPRTLHVYLKPPNFGDVTSLTLERLRWRHWGGASALARRATLRLCSDTGGCQRHTATVRLSALAVNGCGEQSALAYGAATISGVPILGTGPVRLQPLLSC